jgi:hypothetical protein
MVSVQIDPSRNNAPRPFAGSPFDFGKHLASETEKGGEVIRTANIKPE